MELSALLCSALVVQVLKPCRYHDMTFGPDRQGKSFIFGLMAHSFVSLISTGPLPEPVVNGGMEEKVRSLNS